MALTATAVAFGGMLVTATPAAAGIDVKAELECLALTIYFEVRGETE